ncbi:DUF3300 domain-containing protein [Pseudomonas sp. BN515]|uniref:DUF3300 domain-containing protein n=1 Tax=Pseudomonas sp. BN515 TaxID=2567892 RepID=UPI002456A265|nr:DUF3300 domain-containing protein [Pseudomonas sp. BN515]MDH4872295.1 DUF3300 domain-containing protein [Pseudomonas sp. BN515]
MPIRNRFSALLLALLASGSAPLYAATDAGISAAEDDTPTAGVSAVPAEAPAPAPQAAAPAAQPATQPAAAQAVFSVEELDQMMAPIALYPDSLLAQVLMATTYPGNVADAVAWSKAHPDAKGDDAVKQVANQPWDPSVQSLVAFPQVLATLGQDPAWVQRVGDAFLAQPNDVMDSVQRLRRQAQAAGNLQSNEQQTVTVQAAPPPSSTTTVVQPAASNQTIVIEPANPQVVYVPSYNPTVVYGTWSYPSYPPPYYPPPPSYGYPIATGLAAGLAFGVGVGIVNSLWGDCDWGGGDVDIDVNKYNNINSNRQINRNQNKFVHNPANRQGVPYRDNLNRQQNGLRLNGGEQRQALRGYDGNRTAQRQRASQSLQQRGIQAPAATNQQARERAQAATRDMRNDPQARQRAEGVRQQRQAGDANRQQRPRAQNNQQVRQQARQQNASARQGPRNNAFAGARQPSQTRAAANRGQASRASASRPHQSAAGRQVQRPAHAPSRGGGGRRR